MGKRQYSKIRSFGNAADEKQRIREKVLDVFRARVNSPDGGPAILIKDSPVPALCSVISCSSASSEDNRMENMVASRQRKCCKRRRERLRKCHQKADGTNVRDDSVIQHLRKAQKVSVQNVNSSAHEDTAFSMITQNRITRHLGLFNCGKKSGKVFRDPLVIPRAMRQMTEEEFVKIVAHSDLNSPSSSDGVDGVITPTQPMCLSLPSSDVSTRSSIRDQDAQLPRNPQYEEFEESCLCNLQSLKDYEDRDLAQEICRDLRKLFKKSDDAELRGSRPDSLNSRCSSHQAGLAALTTPPCKRQATNRVEWDTNPAASLNVGPRTPVDVPAHPCRNVLPAAPPDIPPSAPLDVLSTLQCCEEVLQTEVRDQSVAPAGSGSVVRGRLLDDARGLLLQDCLAVQSSVAATTSQQQQPLAGAGLSHSAGGSRSPCCRMGASCHSTDCGLLQQASCVGGREGVGAGDGMASLRACAHSRPGLGCPGDSGVCECRAVLSPNVDLQHLTTTTSSLPLPDLAQPTSLASRQPRIASINTNVISEYLHQLPVLQHRDVLGLPPSPLALQQTLDSLECGAPDMSLSYLDLTYSLLEGDNRSIARSRLPHYLLETGLSPDKPPLQSPSPPKLYPRRLY